jgi:hypothetical protein
MASRDLEPCNFLANDSGVFGGKIHILCVSTALRILHRGFSQVRIANVSDPPD